MTKCVVTATKLNKRNAVPHSLSDKAGIVGVVNKGFAFEATEVPGINDPLLGKWFKDRDNYFYWGGALSIVEEEEPEQEPDTTPLDNLAILPAIKRKIEQVINIFETGSAAGNYAAISRYADHTDPATGNKIVQVTYGRSQTTEFGNLKALLEDYIADGGAFAAQLQPYMARIGKKPSLATDATFCQALIDAGKKDPIMKASQDSFFDAKYYQPAFSWFSVNGFKQPLSMLVIYDSFIHSGSIPSFLRKRFPTRVPVAGGSEQEWITNYVNTRHDWLANHTNALLQKTAYRTQCFKDQLKSGNWQLAGTINAHGVVIT